MRAITIRERAIGWNPAETVSDVTARDYRWVLNLVLAIAIVTTTIIVVGVAVFGGYAVAAELVDPFGLMPANLFEVIDTIF